MLVEQTIEKLNRMKLFGMVKSYSERRIMPDHKGLSFDELFGLVVEDEYLNRKNRRLQKLLKEARLKIPSACLEDVDYTTMRGLIKNIILNLQSGQWLDQHQNILITGPTGVGKTYLACAFGQFACRNGYRTHYYRCPRLFEFLSSTRGDGSFLRSLKNLSRAELLILDDFGINHLDDTNRKDLLEIIEDRHLSCSTIITSQLPLEDWHEYIGDPTIADAICDRIFHVANKFELKGVSMRKPQKMD